MITNVLLANQPELFYTINIFPGLRFSLISLSFTLGVALTVASLMAAGIFYFKNKTLNNARFNHLLIILSLLAWLPLYANFLYNNIYDLTENLDYLEYSRANKLTVRLCNMDNRQNLGGIFCRLFPFFTFVKNNLPANSTVQLLATPSTIAYFNYYLYPGFKISPQADIILFYYPSDYFYKDGQLFKRRGEKNILIGRYNLLSARSAKEFILKKITL